MIPFKWYEMHISYFSGGNTTTGPLGWRFISPERRLHIVELYHFDTIQEGQEFAKVLLAQHKNR